MVPISENNLTKHELIGLKVEVTESPDASLVGKKGKIVDETQNTLVIEEADGMKNIQKSAVVLRAELPDGTQARIDGKKITVRPEDRVKKCR